MPCVLLPAREKEQETPRCPIRDRVPTLRPIRHFHAGRIPVDSLTENRQKISLLMGILRENSEAGNTLLVTTSNLPALLEAARPPHGLFDAVDRLLQWVHAKAKSPADGVHLNPSMDYPIVYGADQQEFSFYVQKAKEMDLLDVGSNMLARLSVGGWKRAYELRRSAPRSRQAFIAMWFCDDLTELGVAISKALRDTGYEPVRMDLVEHNDRIDDRILAEVRRSSLMVADFTGSRGGVYFEAGVAVGLGIPVIWMCRKAEIDHVHFDTRQYNHVLWGNPDDAYSKLRTRIEASTPISPGTVLD